MAKYKKYSPDEKYQLGANEVMRTSEPFVVRMLRAARSIQFIRVVYFALFGMFVLGYLLYFIADLQVALVVSDFVVVCAIALSWLFFFPVRQVAPLRTHISRKPFFKHDPAMERKRKGPPEPPAGVVFLGVTNDGNDQWIFASYGDIRLHTNIFGASGSGKTEYILALKYNYFCLGTGLIDVDAKGDPENINRVAAMARFNGLDDDVTFVNHSIGEMQYTPKGNPIIKQTNSLAILSSREWLGSARMISSLIPEPSTGGANQSFIKGGIQLINCIIRIHYRLRELYGENVSVVKVKADVSPEKLFEFIGMHETPSRDYSEAIRGDDNLRETIESLIISFTGNPKQKYQQMDGQSKAKYAEQYGYAAGHAITALETLANTYGDVYGDVIGDISYVDAFAHKRIHMEIMPAMQATADEIKSLGQLFVQGVLSGLAASQGYRVEGKTSSVTEGKPDKRVVPFMGGGIDEAPAIMVDGIEKFATMARGAGMGSFYGSQDFKGASGKGQNPYIHQILGSTQIHVYMKIQDIETFNIIKGTLGKEYTLVTEGVQVKNRNSLSPALYDKQSASVREEDRVRIQDFLNFSKGEYVIRYDNKRIFGVSPYTGPLTKFSKLKINYFVNIGVWYPNDVHRIVSEWENFESVDEMEDFEVPNLLDYMASNASMSGNQISKVYRFIEAYDMDVPANTIPAWKTPSVCAAVSSLKELNTMKKPGAMLKDQIFTDTDDEMEAYDRNKIDSGALTLEQKTFNEAKIKAMIKPDKNSKVLSEEEKKEAIENRNKSPLDNYANSLNNAVKIAAKTVNEDRKITQDVVENNQDVVEQLKEDYSSVKPPIELRTSLKKVRRGKKK